MTAQNSGALEWSAHGAPTVGMIRIRGGFMLTLEVAPEVHITVRRIRDADLLAVSMLIAGLDPTADEKIHASPTIYLGRRKREIRLMLCVRSRKAQRMYDVEVASSYFGTQFQISEKLLKEFGKWLGEVATDPPRHRVFDRSGADRRRSQCTDGRSGDRTPDGGGPRRRL